MSTVGQAAPAAAMGSPIVRRPATIEDDDNLIGPWTRAFGAVCGAPVAITPLDPGDRAAGLCLTFPRVFQPIELIGGTGHFARHPAMAERVRRLGFAWDDSGRLMTVPAPGAFNARLRSLGDGKAGFQLTCAEGHSPAMPLGPWLLRYMHGTITLLINTPDYYDAFTDPDQLARQHSDPRWGLLSVAHDLSVHAVNYHLVPHDAVSELADRIRAALPERYAAWSQPDATAPLTLTYFYDNDFNRYTYAVWCRCERPEQFASIFRAPRNFAQLVEALEVRVGETEAGIGDVASHDFDDMAPLAPTSFAIG